jgi:mannose-6-phosphate isomerase
MYDYGRLTAAGKPRELHIERSLDVSIYDVSPKVKVKPVELTAGSGYEETCLVACRYFVTRLLQIKHSSIHRKTAGSCIILSSLGAEAHIHYGDGLAHTQSLPRGQTMILPAALGEYRIEGNGKLLYSYVPDPKDESWLAWRKENEQ